MKIRRDVINVGFLFTIVLALGQIMNPAFAALTTTTNTSIPWEKLGEKASANYKGAGLSISPTVGGARLHCAFQQIDGNVTESGLWLTSTLTNRAQEQFQVKAMQIERAESHAVDPNATSLPDLGAVTINGKTISFIRPGLVEEYSVSMDGVRQDFVVKDKPAGAGNLQVRLAVEGAKVMPTPYGAQLILTRSGRKLAYSRLQATDAAGRTLPAKIVARTDGELALQVDDANAVYPVRIDPTFSDANWVVLNTGTSGLNDNVYAMVADTKGNLYVGGAFNSAGGVPVEGIAKWNGNAWSAVGPTTNFFTVDSLAMDSAGNLYAGLSSETLPSSTPNAVEKWNGSTWSVVGGYFNDEIDALAVDHSGNVYAGGEFTSAGGVTAYFVAEWNGSTWESLNLGMNGYVNALAVDPAGHLYAGGYFTYAGGVAANYIAEWNGSTWAPLGSGMNGWVTTLATDSTGRLYAGGYFYEAGGATNYFIAQWNGSGWSSVGKGAVGNIESMTVDTANNLYVCVDVPGTNSFCAKWNGSAWTVYYSPLDGSVSALAVDSAGNFYAGGYFTEAGFEPAGYIAKWKGNAWTPIDPGINNGVNAVALDNENNLYIGGYFTWAGNGPANYVAKWNGSTWSALGPGLGDFVRALVLDSAGNLYAGGVFTNAGAVVANGIAKWNGSTWSALGSGIAGPENITVQIYSLAVGKTGNLYAGGTFTSAGGVAASDIAEWNGSAWLALSSGMNGQVSALAVDNSGNLYAGGKFTTAGTVSASYIAEWNGSAWSALGSGMDNLVAALVTDSAGDLYAAGAFSTAGGMTVNLVAEWSSGAWSALGTGIPGIVGGEYPDALALDKSGNLYAGGQFIFFEGTNVVNNIAEWNGSTWSPLTSGIQDGPFSSMAFDSAGNLYVGGPFLIAGTNVSPYVAEALISPSTRPLTIGNFGFANQQSQFTLTGPVSSNAVIWASSNLVSWLPLSTNPLTAYPLNFTDASATNFPHRFYRATLQP